MQIFRASAVVIRRMTGHEPNICRKCCNTLKDEFENPLRNCDILTNPVGDSPPLVICERGSLHTHHERRPDTGPSSPLGYYLPGSHELPVASSELTPHLQHSISELPGDGLAESQTAFGFRRAQVTAGISPERHTNDPTPSTDSCCMSGTAVHSRSTDIWSDIFQLTPAYLQGDIEGSITTHQAEVEPKFQTGTEHHCSDIERPSERLYNPSWDQLTEPHDAFMAEPKEQPLFQDRFVNSISVSRRGKPRAHRKIHSLSLHIPPMEMNDESFSWEPDMPGKSIEHMLGLVAGSSAPQMEKSTKCSLVRSSSSPTARTLNQQSTGARGIRSSVNSSPSLANDLIVGSDFDSANTPIQSALQCADCGFRSDGKAEMPVVYYHKHRMIHSKGGFHFPRLNQPAPHVEPSCALERSVGKVTPDVSPDSLAKPLSTLARPIPMQCTNFEPCLGMSPTANIKPASPNLVGYMCNPVAYVTSSIGIPDISPGVSPQISLGDDGPPSLGVGIPPETCVQVKSINLGSDYTDFTPYQCLDLGTSDTAPETTTTQSFENTLTRSFTDPFPQTTSAVAIRSARNIHIRRQQSNYERMLHYSTISPNHSGETSSSPMGGDDAKQVVPNTDTRRHDCGFMSDRKHRTTHLGVRYSCPHCNKTYARKDNFVAHAKRIHHVYGLETPFPPPGGGMESQGSDTGDQGIVQRQRSRSCSSVSSPLSSSR
ncbi:uncharacterized protein PG998_013100 [Apiospora kogelbergensis]|uniref:uncharacterized protein n=1 Tax=Apiospora kogelbergensis TaxID=1337665 RepID=UPI00312F5E52